MGKKETYHNNVSIIYESQALGSQIMKQSSKVLCKVRYLVIKRRQIVYVN